jgi:hypothetical protein
MELNRKPPYVSYDITTGVSKLRDEAVHRLGVSECGEQEKGNGEWKMRIEAKTISKLSDVLIP